MNELSLLDELNFHNGGYETNLQAYYEPVPTQFSNGDALEEENEKMTDELKDKIHVLKSLSIDIGTEVKFQDKMLRDMVTTYFQGKEILETNFEEIH
uniref:t-SNARE coiled-coil homology domain-containing protein n=1 Tax=Timema tahoe TaxID=61484 RepID=A0A7R9ISE9_9NEOP|nr:unnamed protein product [Timema tahoe]